MGERSQPLKMTAVESSIVIPVHNQWKLTKSCLLGLYQTLKGKQCEIIIVDNASTDLTSTECPGLGKELFGERFIYHRADRNMNFGPASNLGAQLGSGEFVVFLNNDTVPLAGWYDPLIEDFAVYPNIAATGPVLLYPRSAPFGFTVQHMGVYITPFRSVGHLYEGIAADSPLVQKRRFFQVITAACMMMRRQVFLDAGMFDEVFINGFEDVDLCARLSSQGYVMTVNPQARVIHLTSQTPGRRKFEQHNAIHLAKKVKELLKADWTLHCKADEMDYRLGLDLSIEKHMASDVIRRLDTQAEHLSFEELQTLLVRYPFWKKGCFCLLDTMYEKNLATKDFAMFVAKSWFCPRLYKKLYEEACATQESSMGKFVLDKFISICEPFSFFVDAAQTGQKTFAELGLDDFRNRCGSWLRHQDTLHTALYLPAIAAIRELDATKPLEQRPAWAQPLWRELRQKLASLNG